MVIVSGSADVPTATKVPEPFVSTALNAGSPPASMVILDSFVSQLSPESDDLLRLSSAVTTSTPSPQQISLKSSVDGTEIGVHVSSKSSDLITFEDGPTITDKA